MANGQSIPDLAALLVGRTAILTELHQQLREVEGEWTTISLGGSEVTNAASDALRHAILLTDRLSQIAREALAAKRTKK